MDFIKLDFDAIRKHIEAIPEEYRGLNLALDLLSEFEYVVCYSKNEQAPLAGFDSIEYAVKFIELIDEEWQELEGRLIIKSCLQGNQLRRQNRQELLYFKEAFKKFLRIK